MFFLCSHYMLCCRVSLRWMTKFACHRTSLRRPLSSDHIQMAILCIGGSGPWAFCWQWASQRTGIWGFNPGVGKTPALVKPIVTGCALDIPVPSSRSLNIEQGCSCWVVVCEHPVTHASGTHSYLRIRILIVWDRAWLEQAVCRMLWRGFEWTAKVRIPWAEPKCAICNIGLLLLPHSQYHCKVNRKHE